MKFTDSALRTLLALVLVVGLGACSTNVAPSVQADDAAITATVKTQLAADPDVAAHNIDVDTNKGIVTLSGTVEDQNEKQEAERIASGVDGVQRVINNLTVDSGAAGSGS